MAEEQAWPVNRIPAVVVALCALIMGIELMFQLGEAGLAGGPQAVGWRMAAIADFGFSPAVWERVTQAGDFSFAMLRRCVTYAFVHGSFTHAIFAGVLLLALGKFVGEGMGQGAVMAVFLAATVGGAVVFGLSVAGNLPLFGAYPGVYGLIGAYTYLLWLRIGRAGGPRVMAFRMIGVLMAVQLVFGVIFGAQPTWIADLAGFAVGGAVAILVAPGGWSAFVARVRQR
jgi:membrane associated rhomboid family serine protease